MDADDVGKILFEQGFNIIGVPALAGTTPCLDSFEEAAAKAGFQDVIAAHIRFRASKLAAKGAIQETWPSAQDFAGP